MTPSPPRKQARASRRIVIVTPAPRGSLKGNRITAERWARMLRSLGHRVAVRQDWRGEPCDVLIALHARMSGRAALRFARAHPDRPLIVGLAGTDIHPGLERSRVALEAVRRATRLVALQRQALASLPLGMRAKARVVIQSAQAPRRRHARRRGIFEVAVVGHLRPVKDPFRAAIAARRLPEASRMRILHAGRALTAAAQARARREELRNPRYRWLGELSHPRALALLARCQAVVISSWSEGGANVVSEAIACGTAVIASRVAGNVGLLGVDHPGLFEPGATAELATLLHRFETDDAFRSRVLAAGRRLAPRFRPAAEQGAWRELLREIE